MSSLGPTGLLLIGAFGAAACDYDIPSLPGGAGGGTGTGGEGGGASCSFAGCSECVAPMLCDPAMGCVQCLEDTDCTDGDYPVCDNYRCVECTIANTDRCQDGDVCSQGHCANACNVAQDCTGGGEFCPGEVCKFGRCICCEMNGDCTQDNDNVCTEAGICTQCVTDADCENFNDGTQEKCRADGACVACLVSEDCPQPALCTANACEPKCCDTTDCAIDSAAPICDTVAQSCIACTGEGECLKGDCVSGHCIECTDDASCLDKDFPACVTGICQECSETHECADPNVCYIPESKCYAPT